MKKFSLLALVAVMVMAFAGAAFANDGDVTLTPITTFNATQNNSKIANDSTNIYYFGTAPTSFVLGLDANVDGAASGGGAENKPLVANWSKATDFTNKVDLVDSLSAVANPNLAKTITNAVLTGNDADTVLKIGVLDSSAWLASSTPAELTIVPTVVSADVANVTGDTTSTVINAELKNSIVGVKWGTMTFELDTTNAAGVKAITALESDGKTIKIEPNSTKFTVGTTTITVKAEKATVTEDANEIAVAGLSSATQIAQFTVKVTPAKTNDASFLPNDTTSYTVDVANIANALVISTDISTDKVAAASSADLKLFVNDVALNAKSFDVAFAAAGYTFALPVATQRGLAPVNAASVYVTDETSVMTNKLTLTITQTPVYPVAPTTPEQKAAIQALVVGSADLGLATATSHDADNTAVTVQIPSALSNDVRAFRSIDQTVATSGDYVMIDGSQINVAPKSGESVTFYKNFGTITEPDRVSLREAMSGDVLEAAVLIVDNELPANVQGAWKSSKDSKKGVVFRKVNGTNVVVIYDGNKNGSVVDPIEAHVNRGSSSSSCDMGFGAAALAGLAVLALRKRSK